MAQLKNTTVTGSLNVTDTMAADTIKTRVVKAPISSGSLNYSPGVDGRVLRSNGSSVFWGPNPVGDVVKVQTATPTLENTMIWFPETTPTTVQVPTYSEFQAALDRISALETQVGINQS